MNDDLHHLFADFYYGAVAAKFAQTDVIPDDALISNINIVPFVGDRVVLLRLVDGRYEVPGGTREPGEAYLETVRRELLEEAGARLIDYTPFGAWFCHSTSVQPYRPHLPHPDFYRLAGYGAVELVAPPSNPTDGEQVADVLVLTVAEAVEQFHAADRPDFADLYLLASRIREGRA